MNGERPGCRGSRSRARVGGHELAACASAGSGSAGGGVPVVDPLDQRPRQRPRRVGLRVRVGGQRAAASRPPARRRRGSRRGRRRAWCPDSSSGGRWRAAGCRAARRCRRDRATCAGPRTPPSRTPRSPSGRSASPVQRSSRLARLRPRAVVLRSAPHQTAARCPARTVPAAPPGSAEPQVHRRLARGDARERAVPHDAAVARPR